jgi:hypothetical protein
MNATVGSLNAELDPGIDRQPEALRCFQSSGYEEIPPFTDGVFTRHLMEKSLS